MPRPKKAATEIYQLKVTLRHVRPPIWRRIHVPGDITLRTLHEVLQDTIGWMGGHLHQYVVKGVFYGEPDPDFGFPLTNDKRARLRDVVGGVKDKFIYEYDFGDGWEHDILVEAILQPEPGVTYPLCVKGKRNCPPEDVGGPWGYANFLEAIRNKDHPEHQEYLDWIGGSFDPEEFDLKDLNEYLKSARRLQR